MARAIIEAYEERYGELRESPEEAEIITGQGLKVKIEGKIYLIGNRKLLTENNVNITEGGEENYIKSEEEHGQTVVIVSDLEKVLGTISIADTVREDAKELIINLKKTRH